MKQQLRLTSVLTGKLNISVGIVTRFNDADGSIPCEGKRLSPSPKYRNKMWGAPLGGISLKLRPPGCTPDSGTTVKVKAVLLTLWRLPTYIYIYIYIYIYTHVVGSKCFWPDIQKPRQMENAVRDI